jgi:hypothetical protein
LSSHCKSSQKKPAILMQSLDAGLSWNFLHLMNHSNTNPGSEHGQNIHKLLCQNVSQVTCSPVPNRVPNAYGDPWA